MKVVGSGFGRRSTRGSLGRQVSAVSLWDPGLLHLAARADLLATAVGASALPDVGRVLAPLLRARLAASEAPINVITFENHRRAPELLAASLIGEDPFLARTICQTVGIGARLSGGRSPAAESRAKASDSRRKVQRSATRTRSL